MTAGFYLATMVVLCVIAIIASLVYHLINSYRELVRNIRMAEITIVDRLETRLSGDTLDSVVDIVTTELELALHSE